MTATLPTLATSRLVLRPFELADAGTVETLAGDREVAATVLNIPHPYPEGAACSWISTHREAAESGAGFTFAIVRSSDNLLIGAIGLHVDLAHNKGELGYWLGRPYWNNGYTTEAARAIIDFSFEQLGLNRIKAVCMARNVASARVMQKAGMKYEGVLRQEILKWDAYEDIAVYGLLRSEHQTNDSSKLLATRGDT